MGKKQSKLVVAIEIGNVNSGYAYGIGTDKRFQIHTATHGYGLPSNRVPTILLLKKDGTFDAFGHFAKDKFMSLSLQGKQDQYKYFDNIKDIQEENSKLVVYDRSKANPSPAEDLYYMIIDHLYTICKTQVEKFCTSGFETDLVHIIVPNNTCYIHDVIKSVLEMPQLRNKTVNLVLDTDAAAAYCRDQPLLKSKRNKPFILANLGGYSSKFCYQTISDMGKYDDLVEHSPLPYGGESVTDSFMNISFGKDVDSDEFKRTHGYDLMHIRHVFNENKHKFDGYNESLMMELPSYFVGIQKNGGLNVNKDNKIHLTDVQMKKLFMKSQDEIVGTIKTLDEDIKQKEAPIFLTGGFSKSPYLREVIKEKIKPKDVVLVHEPQLAVLKGAVIMGFDDTLKAKYDYGFIRPDNPSGSLDLNIRTVQGKDDVFQTILRKGRMLKDNDTLHATLRIPEDEREKAIVLYKKVTSDSGDTDEKLEKEKETIPPINGWGDEVIVCVKLSIKDNQLKVNLSATSTVSISC